MVEGWREVVSYTEEDDMDTRAVAGFCSGLLLLLLLISAHELIASLQNPAIFQDIA